MKKVYMTYLGTDNYLIGVLALNFQLKYLKSKYPLVVLISNKISLKSKQILRIKRIPYILGKAYVPSVKLINANNKFGMPHWSETFGKLAIFGLTGYGKIVYLDSDMLILKNIDQLFNSKNLSAVIAGTSYPGNEKWSQTLNSGLMVITPEKGRDQRLFNLIKENKITHGGDQNIIHLGYPDWPNNKELHLDESYNLLAPYESYYLKSGLINHKKLKVVHFIGPLKPWDMSELRKYRHCFGIIINSARYNKSFKGINDTLKDFLMYYKICKKIKNEIDIL